MSIDVGLIGAGRIGHFVGLNLLAAGYTLHVFDIKQTAADTLIQTGAHWHESPASIARASQITILSLFGSEDVQNVLTGPKGMCTVDLAGKIIIDTTTIPPADTRRYAHSVAENGGILLDAPVTGGEGGAEAGTLTIMVGGDEQAFTQCQAVFDVIGGQITYLGPSGAGQVVKMANQAIMVAALGAIAETIHFVERAGVDMDGALDVLTRGGARSPLLEGFATRYQQGADQEHDPIRTQHYSTIFEKDIRYAMASAAEAGQPLTVAERAHAILQRVNQTETYDTPFPLNILKSLRESIESERRPTGR